MLIWLITAAVAATMRPSEIEQTPWHVGEHKDKMTDQVRLTAEAITKDGGIFIGCDAPAKYSVRVRFITTAFLGDGLRDLVYRLDGQKAVTLTSQRYSDKVLYTFSTDQLTDWVKAMRTANKMLVRLYDFHGEAVDLEYSMTGAAAAIDQAISGCNDKRFSAK